MIHKYITAAATTILLVSVHFTVSCSSWSQGLKWVVMHGNTVPGPAISAILHS